MTAHRQKPGLRAVSIRYGDPHGSVVRAILDMDDPLPAEAVALASRQRSSLTHLVEEGFSCGCAQSPPRRRGRGCVCRCSRAVTATVTGRQMGISRIKLSHTSCPMTAQPCPLPEPPCPTVASRPHPRSFLKGCVRPSSTARRASRRRHIPLGLKGRHHRVLWSAGVVYAGPWRGRRLR